MALLAAWPVPAALALDGGIDLWNTEQAGGAGLTAYTTSTFQETYRLGQRIPFSHRLRLDLDFVARRQWLESASMLSTSTSHLESLIPTFTLAYTSRGLRAGIDGYASRRDDFPANGASRRDEYGSLEFWLKTEQRWAQLEARWREMAAERTSPGAAPRETEEHQQSVTAEVRPLPDQSLRYRFNRQQQVVPTSDREANYLSHELRLRSKVGFADGRGRASLDATGSTLDQRTIYGGTGAVVLTTPIFGGVSLDDTPEMQDTLEDQPVRVPGLYDADRDTPTEINIGDNAPAVRQYGGDYRNFIFDFGDAEDFNQIILYVDRLVRFPELLQWLVYVSDDPEGRDWGQALAPGQYTAVYDQFENNRQGWLITFASPRRHRFVKIVDVKLGETEPDLFVNEMEVYRPQAGAEDVEVSSDLLRHRVRGDVGYRIARPMELRYSLDLNGKNYDGEGRDTQGIAHSLGLDYRVSSWWFGASYQTYRIDNDSGRDTDSRSQQASLGNDPSRALRGRLGWSRVDDRSYTGKDITNSYSADVAWDIAPRLTGSETVTRGVRDGREGSADSQSWTSVTELRGMPWPTLDFVARRSDRWVSAEAGAGFTNYNDTELNVNWQVVPLVVVSSQVAYEERDDSAWVIRNTLSWTPLPDGSLSPRLYALDFRDTRTDYVEQGGGWNAVWKPRPRLRFEGGQEWTVLEQNGQRNTPTTWNARGTWTF